MRYALGLGLLLCNFSLGWSHEKKTVYQQQFSQQFLETVHQSKPEKTTFSIIDTLYLQKQHEQTVLPSGSKIDYTPLYYALAIICIVVWITYKFHQSLSCIVGKNISDFVVGKLISSFYHSSYWLVRQAIMDAYGIVKLLCMKILNIPVMVSDN